MTNELKEQKSIFQERIKRLEENEKVQTNQINDHKGEAAKYKIDEINKDNHIKQKLEEKNTHQLAVQKNLANLDQKNKEQIKEIALFKQSLEQQDQEHKKQIKLLAFSKQEAENQNKELNEQNLLIRQDLEQLKQENNKQKKEYSAQSQMVEKLNKELSLKNLYIEEQNKSFSIKSKQEKQNTDFISLGIEEIEPKKKIYQDNVLLEEKIAIGEVSIKKDFFTFAFMHHEKCYYQTYATYKSNLIEQIGDIDSDCSPEKRNRFNTIRKNQMCAGFEELNNKSDKISRFKNELEHILNAENSLNKLYSLAYISGQLNI